MSRTGIEVSSVRSNLAHGYQRNQNGTASRESADRALEGRGYRIPNGGLISTVNDLAKFAAWEVGDGPDGILKKATQDANYSRAFFYAPTMHIGYGVGFQVHWYGDVLIHGHGGSTDGYHSALFVNRPTRLGVIVLRNCDSCPVDAIPVAGRSLDQLVKAKRALK
jgi:CubicO group peptidase (beta-lactamase class C family)